MNEPHTLGIDEFESELNPVIDDAIRLNTMTLLQGLIDMSGPLTKGQILHVMQTRVNDMSRETDKPA